MHTIAEDRMFNDIHTIAVGMKDLVGAIKGTQNINDTIKAEAFDILTKNIFFFIDNGGLCFRAKDETLSEEEIKILTQAGIKEI